MIARRLTKHEREAQRLIAEWHAADRRMLELQADLGGYTQVVSNFDDIADRARDVANDYASDHDLCDVCGLRKTIDGWEPGDNCPEHTTQERIEHEVTEWQFDLDAWCAAHNYTRDGWTVRPNGAAQ
jgi:hypothetical protein